jgi:type I restriction enzyme S subunit
MKTPWPETPLGDILAERREMPNEEAVLSGRQPIIAKIRFADGGMEFRASGESKTNLISIHPGDLVLSGINAAKGAIALYEPADRRKAAATIHYSSYSMDRERVEPRFLWLLLRHGVFRERLERFVPNGIKTELKAGKFLPIPIPLPPMSEQRRIVAKIDQIAARVEEAKRLRSSNDEMMKNLYRGMVRDVLAKACKEHSVSSLGALFEYRQELIRPGTKRKAPLRFVGLQHVEPHTGRRIGEDTLDPQTLRGRKFTFQAGDILYGYLRPYLNKVWLADLDGACSVDQYVLIPRHEMVLPEYLAAIIRSPLVLDVAEEKTNPLTLPRLSSGDFGAIEVPLPEHRKDQQALLQRIETIRQSIVKLAETQRAQTEESEALMPALLDQAFRGEL